MDYYVLFVEVQGLDQALCDRDNGRKAVLAWETHDGEIRYCLEGREYSRALESLDRNTFRLYSNIRKAECVGDIMSLSEYNIVSNAFNTADRIKVGCSFSTIGEDILLVYSKNGLFGFSDDSILNRKNAFGRFITEVLEEPSAKAPKSLQKNLSAIYKASPQDLGCFEDKLASKLQETLFGMKPLISYCLSLTTKQGKSKLEGLKLTSLILSALVKARNKEENSLDRVFNGLSLLELLFRDTRDGTPLFNILLELGFESPSKLVNCKLHLSSLSYSDFSVSGLNHLKGDPRRNRFRDDENEDDIEKYRNMFPDASITEKPNQPVSKPYEQFAMRKDSSLQIKPESKEIDLLLDYFSFSDSLKKAIQSCLAFIEFLEDLHFETAKDLLRLVDSQYKLDLLLGLFRLPKESLALGTFDGWFSFSCDGTRLKEVSSLRVLLTNHLIVFLIEEVNRRISRDVESLNETAQESMRLNTQLLVGNFSISNDPGESYLFHNNLKALHKLKRLDYKPIKHTIPDFPSPNATTYSAVRSFLLGACSRLSGGFWEGVTRILSSVPLDKKSFLKQAADVCRFTYTSSSLFIYDYSDVVSHLNQGSQIVNGLIQRDFEFGLNSILDRKPFQHEISGDSLMRQFWSLCDFVPYGVIAMKEALMKADPTGLEFKFVEGGQFVRLTNGLRLRLEKLKDRKKEFHLDKVLGLFSMFHIRRKILKRPFCWIDFKKGSSNVDEYHSNTKAFQDSKRPNENINDLDLLEYAKLYTQKILNKSMDTQSALIQEDFNFDVSAYMNQILSNAHARVDPCSFICQEFDHRAYVENVLSTVISKFKRTPVIDTEGSKTVDNLVSSDFVEYTDLRKTLNVIRKRLNEDKLKQWKRIASSDIGNANLLNLVNYTDKSYRQEKTNESFVKPNDPSPRLMNPDLKETNQSRSKSALLIQTAFRSKRDKRKVSRQFELIFKLQRSFRRFLINKYDLPLNYHVTEKFLARQNQKYSTNYKSNMFYINPSYMTTQNDEPKSPFTNKPSQAYASRSKYDDQKIYLFSKVIDFDLLVSTDETYDSLWGMKLNQIVDHCARQSSPFKCMAVGGTHTLLANSKGRLFSFGWNNHGQCGFTQNSTLISKEELGERYLVDFDHDLEYRALVLNYVDSIRQVTFDSLVDVKGVSCGEDHSLVLDQDGGVWSFGVNSSGQLGLGHKGKAHKPSLVDLKGKKAISIKSEENVNLVLTQDGSVFMWPSTKQNNEINPLPVRIPLPLKQSETITVIACGHNFAVMASSTGAVYSFGRSNKYGQLGHGDSEPRLKPTAIKFFSNQSDRVTQLSCGYKHSVLLLSTGKVYIWGLNSSGQLGLPADRCAQSPQHLAISRKGNQLKVLHIAAGFRSTYLLVEGRRIYHCGGIGAVSPPSLFDLSGKFKEFSVEANFSIVKIECVWNKSMSVLYAVVADSSSFGVVNGSRIMHVLNCLSSRWGANICKYFKFRGYAKYRVYCEVLSWFLYEEGIES